MIEFLQLLTVNVVLAVAVAVAVDVMFYNFLGQHCQSLQQSLLNCMNDTFWRFW